MNQVSADIVPSNYSLLQYTPIVQLLIHETTIMHRCTAYRRAHGIHTGDNSGNTHTHTHSGNTYNSDNSKFDMLYI